MSRILLIKPPFHQNNAPPVELSTIKAMLNPILPCRVFHADLLFQSYFQSGRYYRAFCYTFDFYCAGDYVFAEEAFPSGRQKYRALEENEEQYQTAEADRIITSGSLTDIGTLKYFKTLVPGFLADLGRIITAENPAVIGLDVSEAQLTASLAIARLAKEFDSGVTVFLHGNRCTPGLAGEIMRITSAIDYVFCGEAEGEIARFCRELDRGCLPRERIISCSPLPELDALPLPDYSDYTGQLRSYPHLESAFWDIRASRGCWWTKHKRCLFCDVDGLYRSMSIRRIDAEVSHIAGKYGKKNFYFIDKVMNPAFPGEFLESLAGRDVVREFVLDLRCDTSFKDLYRLKKKGLTYCMAGVETLHDDLLRLMGKGVSALRNIRFLRDAKTLKVIVWWNFLVRIPGERAGSYRAMLRYLSCLFHLSPPVCYMPLVITRNNRLFAEKERLGITDLRPFKVAAYVYPEDTCLAELSGFYIGRFPHALEDESLRMEFTGVLEEWMSLHRLNPPELILIELRQDLALVKDTRPLSRQHYRLITGGHLKLIEKMQTAVAGEVLAAFVLKTGLTQCWTELQEWDYVLSIDDYYLSLPVVPRRVVELESMPEGNWQWGPLQQDRLAQDLNAGKLLWEDFCRQPVLVLAEYGPAPGVQAEMALRRQLEWH